MTTQEAKAMVLSQDHKALLTNYAKNYLAVKQIEKDMKAEVAKLKEVMIENNVLNIDNGEFSLTLSVVKGVKLVDITKVPKNMTKVVLDTAKVNAQATLTGQLPDGVEETTTYKLNAPKEIK